MSRNSKTIKSLSELENLATLERNEIYKQLKPTIDAANKRLKRQGVNVKISTKGKSGIELIALARQALEVQPKQFRQPKQTTPKPPRQPRQTRVNRQLPNNFDKMKRDELETNKSFTNAKTHSDVITSMASDDIKYDLSDLNNDTIVVINQRSMLECLIMIAGAINFTYAYNKSIIMPNKLIRYIHRIKDRMGSIIFFSEIHYIADSVGCDIQSSIKNCNENVINKLKINYF